MTCFLKGGVVDFLGEGVFGFLEEGMVCLLGDDGKRSSNILPTSFLLF